MIVLPSGISDGEIFSFSFVSVLVELAEMFFSGFFVPNSDDFLGVLGFLNNSLSFLEPFVLLLTPDGPA